MMGRGGGRREEAPPTHRLPDRHRRDHGRTSRPGAAAARPPGAPRVRMLRLLQGSAVPTLAACTPAIGYSLRRLAGWWKRYREGGMAGLLAEPPRPGRPSRLTPAFLAGLEGEMRAGRIASLEDVRRWCPRGALPPRVVDDRYRWLWLCAAVEPANGAGFFLLLPGIDQA